MWQSIETTASMQKFADLLQVDEVHVTDDKGILLWGNVVDFYGFDFSGSEQTKPFLQILEDPTFELAQDPQPNGATGVLFQYIGVTRLDQKGIVQIGLVPEVLNQALEETQIDHVLANTSYGIDGYVFAIDKATNKVVSHADDSWIGKDYQEAGISEADLSASSKGGTATIFGEKLFYMTSENDDYIIGVVTPLHELYAGRTLQVALFAGLVVLVFMILIISIYLMLDRQIVRGIKKMIQTLQLITEGNLDVEMDIQSNPEFAILSEGTNAMVTSIKDGLASARQQAEQNQSLLKKQDGLISEISTASQEIADYSQQTLSISQQIRQDTLTQDTSVSQLLDYMASLLTKSKESTSISQKVADNSAHIIDTINEANANMERMMKAMADIEESADQIQGIIGNIDAIASSTNMLALNASIEAARANEHGKGFAVVANQVGTLAQQSAEAAKQTNQLIINTLEAIHRGEDMAQKSVLSFHQVIEESKQAADAMKELVNISQEQAGMVAEASADINQISDIVTNTASISFDSEDTSQKLADKADLLYTLIQ